VRMLIAEDDPKMAAILRRGLEEAGWVVATATDGAEAVHMASEETFDCFVLDVNLPEVNGFEVCRRLRGHQVWAPVLMLTARDAVRDRVEGLDAGADDYLVKPFSFDELLARIRALARRGSVERPTVVTVGDLCIDPATRSVTRAGTGITLSAREYALLEFLAAHAGEVVTRTQILDHVWDVNYSGVSNVVDVYIRYLRNKVDRPFPTQLIHTVRGAGYSLRAAEP
jgi:two-component system, OmpR family, response regulator